MKAKESKKKGGVKIITGISERRMPKADSLDILLSVIRSCVFVYFSPFGVMFPSMNRRIISVLALVRMVTDFLKCPGYLPVPS